MFEPLAEQGERAHWAIGPVMRVRFPSRERHVATKT
jgi:hypothetical protein